MKNKIEKLHTHPQLEKKLGLDSNHVVVDRKTFERLFDLEHGDPVKIVVKEILACIHFAEDKESFRLLEPQIINKWLAPTRR